MSGDEDFDNYLNEVSGEDVTSAETPSTGGETSVTDRAPTSAPTFTQDAPPKGQVPVQSKKDAAATAPKLRPHVLGGFVNEEGDIVDEKGAVIAQKGTVRRVYEENGRLRQRLAQFEQQVNSFQSRSGEANVLNGAPTRLGLDNDDVAMALDLAARVKRGDVVGVAKELVARAVAEGKNVTEIVGSEVGDSVDMRAIKNMFDTHLGPIAQVRQQQEQEKRINEVATQNYNRFIEENPHAELHEFEIANIARTQDISPQKAYNALRDFAQRHQLDFSIPLDQQVRARQADQQRATQPAQQVKPMPNGAARSGGNGMQPPSQQYADPNDDWASIIRDAQKSLRQ